MSGNSFGNLFKITSFGESHGKAIGAVVDGCPSGFCIDFEQINQQLFLRQKGCQRQESNRIQWLSGLLNGKTTGTPICFIIENTDIKSEDYKQEEFILKPSHAHHVYWQKYGIFDYRGGGRASARETAVRVVAGCIAAQILAGFGINIKAYTVAIGKAKISRLDQLDYSSALRNDFVCPNQEVAKQMQKVIDFCKQNNDTIGAKVNCKIQGLPIGLGSPVFDKLSADLAKAMLSINAAKGFEYGLGFDAVETFGSKSNDYYNTDFSTKTNHSGGIIGGISTGEEIYFNVAFKAIATLMRDQESVDIEGNKTVLKAGGRHDVCVAPRVLPVVEAMTAICLLNHYLEFKAYTK